MRESAGSAGIETEKKSGARKGKKKGKREEDGLRAEFERLTGGAGWGRDGPSKSGQ